MLTRFFSRRTIHRSTFVTVIVVALFAVMLPTTAFAHGHDQGGHYRVVQAGDNLSATAKSNGLTLWQLMEDPELIGRELIDQRRRAEAPLADYRAGVTDLVNGLSVRHDRNVLLVGTAMAVLAILPCVSIKKRQVPSPDGGELRQS